MTQFRKCGSGTTACSEKPVSQVHVTEDTVTAFFLRSFPRTTEITERSQTCLLKRCRQTFPRRATHAPEGEATTEDSCGDCTMTPGSETGASPNRSLEMAVFTNSTCLKHTVGCDCLFYSPGRLFKQGHVL